MRKCLRKSGSGWNRDLTQRPYTVKLQIQATDTPTIDLFPRCLRCSAARNHPDCRLPNSLIVAKQGAAIIFRYQSRSSFNLDNDKPHRSGSRFGLRAKASTVQKRQVNLRDRTITAWACRESPICRVSNPLVGRCLGILCHHSPSRPLRALGSTPTSAPD